MTCGLYLDVSTTCAHFLDVRTILQNMIYNYLLRCSQAAWIITLSIGFGQSPTFEADSSFVPLAGILIFVIVGQIIVIPSGVPPTHFIKDVKLRTFADIGKRWKEFVRIDYEIFGSVSFWRASWSASFHSGANSWYWVYYWFRFSAVFPFGVHLDPHHFIYIFFFSINIPTR